MTEYTKLIELVVNDITRVITIPNNNIVLGVVGDIEVNKLMFKMPRYYCGFDMSEFTPKINYVTPNAEGNYYKSELEVTDDVITFTWLLTSDVTEHNGTVKFSISLYKKENGRVSKVFNSRSSVGNVLEGLNVDAYVTPEQQQTILDRLETEIREDIQSFVTEKEASINQQITEKSDAAIKAIDAKKNDVLSTISEDQYIQKIEQNAANVGSLREDIDYLESKVGYMIRDWVFGSINANGVFNINKYAVRTSTYHTIPYDKCPILIKKGYEVYIFQYDDSKTFIRYYQFGSENEDCNMMVKIDTSKLYAFVIQEIGATTSTIVDLSISSNAKIGIDYIYDITKDVDNLMKDVELLKGDKLSGRTWNPVGDSISDTSNTTLGLYVPIIANNLGLSVVNCGKMSSTLAVNNTYMSGKSIVERVCGLNGNSSMRDADIWTVYGGLNDWYYDSPIGTIDSTDNTTIYGALKQICENILGRNNRPKLILCTPLQSIRNGVHNDISMAEIRKAIIDVAEYYSVPCVDLYKYGGFNPINILATKNPTTTDGVHPNYYGTNMWYPVLEKAIKELSFYDMDSIN